MDVSLTFSSDKVATAMPLQLLQSHHQQRDLPYQRRDPQSCLCPPTGQALSGAGGRTDTDWETPFPPQKRTQLLKLTAPHWTSYLGVAQNALIKPQLLKQHVSYLIKEITCGMNLPSLSSSWIFRYKYSSPLPFLPCSAPCILAISVVLPEPSSPASKFVQGKKRHLQNYI